MNYVQYAVCNRTSLAKPVKCNRSLIYLLLPFVKIGMFFGHIVNRYCSLQTTIISLSQGSLMAFFSREVNLRLAKRPLVFNGSLANRGLISLVKEATGVDKSFIAI